MGRVLEFRARTRRAARPIRRGHGNWDASFVIAQGVMRTPTGALSCEGWLLIRFTDDGAWEMTFRDRDITRSVSGTSETPADVLFKEVLGGMFRSRTPIEDVLGG